MSYRDQVAAAVTAVTIRSPTEYAWLGHSSRSLPAALRAELRPLECRRHLVAGLREELYASFYSTGGPVPGRWGKRQPVAAHPLLGTALSDANTGQGSWDPGWIVRSYNDDEAVVSKPRLRVRVPAAECRADSGGSMRLGARVSVRLPKQLPPLSPGFFTVLGDAEFEPGASSGMVRVYWHITASGARALVRAITSLLNQEAVPFRLKVADHPARFDRCDAGVLYLPIEAYKAVGGMLAHVAATLRPCLRPKIPALTLGLAPGVGLAESPGSGESFGEHRSAVLADAIVDAHERGLVRDAARVDVVIASLGENGVRIDAPYLEPSLDGRHVF